MREDAAVEVALLRSHPRARRIVAVASGGCTAFALRGIAAPDAMVWGIDVNAAQIHLCAWKLAALRLGSHETFLAALEHDARPLHTAQVRTALDAPTREFWDARIASLRHGANHCGAIDERMRRAMRLFFATIASRRTMESLLSLRDPDEQRRMFADRIAGRRWRFVFHGLLGRPVLRIVFGRGIAAQIPANFADIVRTRVESALLATPAHTNPCVWQTFLARYRTHDDEALPAAWQRASVDVIRTTSDRLGFETADLAVWLEKQPARSVDFIALSNIHEAAPPSFVVRLGAAVNHAAAPGGLIVSRAILSGHFATPDGSDLTLDAEKSTAASGMDRGGVCADVRVWRRPES